jgi:hypothetical protein
MRICFCLLVCCLTLIGCASDSQVVRETAAPVEEAAKDIPPGTTVLVLGAPETERVDVPSVFLPVERGGRGRLGERTQPPLLSSRPTREEIAARRRQAEEYWLVQQAREQYYQALAEARARYPNHQGHQEHHFIPIYLGGPRTGAT